MIYNNDDRLREWYNDEAPINKVMGAGSVIFQRLHDSNPHKNIVYRWVVVEDDYICQGTTKYEKLKEQISDDYGATWTDVYPPMYKKGNVIEYDCPDCGYVPPQYRWLALDPSVDYICSGTSKYVKEVKQVSWDEGVTWENVVPEESRMGELVETDCRDCGYRTRTTSGSQYCNGDDLYVDVYSQVSTDGGRTWTTTATTSTLVQAESPTCMCYNPSAGAKSKKTYFEYEYGTSPVTNRTGYINCSSNTTLNGSDLDNIARPTTHEHFSYKAIYVGNCIEIASGVTTTYATKYAIGENNILREVRNSFNYGAFCEGVLPYMPYVELIHGSFNNSNIVSFVLPNTLTAITNSFERVSGITEVTIPDSVQTIGSGSFKGCSNLTTLNIGSGITSIGYESFNGCGKLRTITITATTPPALGQYTFDGRYITVYVPDESVELYKTSGRWANFSSKIKPISTKP